MQAGRDVAALGVALASCRSLCDMVGARCPYSGMRRGGAGHGTGLWVRSLAVARVADRYLTPPEMTLPLRVIKSVFVDCGAGGF